MKVVLRALLDSSPEAVLIVGLDSRIIDLNVAARRLFYPEGHAAPGELLPLCLNSVDRTRMKRLIDAAVERGHADWDQEIRFRGATAFVPAHLSVDVVRAENGDIESFIMRIYPAETAPGDADCRARASDETEGILIIEGSTRIVYDCDRSVEFIFGFSRNQLIGKTTEQLHRDNQAFRDFALHAADSYAKGLIKTGSFLMKDNGGAPIQVRYKLIPLRKMIGRGDLFACFIKKQYSGTLGTAPAMQLVQVVGELESLLSDLKKRRDNAPGGPPLSRCTPKEREIANRAAAGETSKSIAIDLGIAESTVKNHLGRIYRKLRVSGRVELTRLIT